MPVRALRSTTAAKSSTTNIPTTNRPRIVFSSPVSLSILTMTAELEIETAAPRKNASLALQPSHFPT